MIKIVKNESFPKWMQIFAFGNLVEEIDSKSKALRIAKKLARENKIKYFDFLGETIFT
jgi:hypothetical protein